MKKPFIVPERVQGALASLAAPVPRAVAVETTVPLDRPPEPDRAPVAQDIVAWAASLAATGLLDPFGGHGVEIYRSEGRRSAAVAYVRSDASIRVTTRSLGGGAAAHARDAYELSQCAPAHLLDELHELITSGGIWSHIERAARDQTVP